LSEKEAALSHEAHMVREKKDLRKRLIAKREALSKELRRSLSDRASLHALSLIETLAAAAPPRPLPLTLTAFLSFGSEVDTRPLIASLLEGPRPPRLLLPSLRHSKTIVLRPYDRETPLVPGPFGILEPETAESVLASEVDLFILPGIGFDRSGGRLGYGKGYFDRLLAGKSVAGKRIGLAFSAQIADRIPTASHDHPMDYLVTEEGWLTCG
jgi:5-formyltetrahydrofolate cyclo-ligase